MTSVSLQLNQQKCDSRNLMGKSWELQQL